MIMYDNNFRVDITSAASADDNNSFDDINKEDLHLPDNWHVFHMIKCNHDKCAYC